MKQKGLDGPLDLEDTLGEAFNKAGLRLMSLLLNLPGLRVPESAPRQGEVRAGTRACDVFTRFGHARVENRAYLYNKHAKKGRFPFDDALRLVNGATPALARRALECAAKEPFDKAAETLRKTLTPEMTPDLLKHLVRDAGRLAAGFFKTPPGASTPPSASCPPQTEHPACAVVMADGTGVPLRRKHLRGVKGRGPDGKPKTREAKLAAFFETTPVPGQPAKRAPHSTTHVATLERKAPFAELMRAEYRRRFPRAPELTLFISDGAAWLRGLRRTHFPHAVEILDFYHAAEHLTPLLELAGYAGKTQHAMRRKWRRWLKEGKVGKLIDVCRALAAGAGADAAQSWAKALGYYEANRGRMKYDEYLAKGWFIGSGVVEAACKTLIGARFKQAGMRWSRAGVKALLPFRAALLSERMDALWEYILEKRRRMNAA
ncbi:MAG: ISKra4 family transposase [Kiritimatiellaeota bacterium]|nr:ISKra4 family transposase [Kiritimatiellota bacterium]